MQKNKFINKACLAFACFLPALFICLVSNVQRKQSVWGIISPNGQLQITLSNKNGQLFYHVLSAKDTVIGPSRLGVEKEYNSFTNGLTYIDKISSRKIDEQYIMKTGKQVHNHAVANEISVGFKNTNGDQLFIDLRAYDDGVAFRYRFEGKPTNVTITGELTEFAVPPGRAWIQNYAMSSRYDPSYEYPYINNIATGTPANEISGWSFPALFHIKDNWLLITEANVTKDYCGSHLKQYCENGKYSIAFPQAGEANGFGSVNIKATLPFSSPWRVIITGKEPSTIVQSNLVHHLADKNKIGNTDWIKPGSSSWSWWSDHASSRSFQKLKKFIDLARDIGWEYSLVDANWNRMEGGNIEQLIRYAESKNIPLSLWYNSGGMHNDVPEDPRYIMNDPEKRKAELKKLRQWGIKAIKVDFFQSDKQSMMQQYIDILEDAAKEKIMVIFHGCTLPRGWSRTYPNLLSMEGIRGAEQYGWDSVIGRKGAEYNTINVFTRNVVGPMDYTPVTFSSYACCPHTTTNTHELALSVLYESGMQHFADSDSAYRSQPDEVKNFLGRVPNTWDEIKFISGQPGKDVVLARRKGTKWYVAGINGEDIPKQLRIDFSFLGKKTYKAILFRDGNTVQEIHSESKIYRQNAKGIFDLLPKGGFVMELVPD